MKKIFIISLSLFLLNCDSQTIEGCDYWCDDFATKGFSTYLQCHNECMGDLNEECPYGKLNCGQVWEEICISPSSICDGECDCQNCFDEKCDSK